MLKDTNNGPQNYIENLSVTRTCKLSCPRRVSSSYSNSNIRCIIHINNPIHYKSHSVINHEGEKKDVIVTTTNETYPRWSVTMSLRRP
jgi:aspartate carbamoyltransferase regulatory subunit